MLSIMHAKDALRISLIFKIFSRNIDVASDVGVNFKNVGVLSVESSQTFYKLDIKEKVIKYILH